MRVAGAGQVPKRKTRESGRPIPSRPLDRDSGGTLLRMRTLVNQTRGPARLGAFVDSFIKPPGGWLARALDLRPDRSGLRTQGRLPHPPLRAELP